MTAPWGRAGIVWPLHGKHGGHVLVDAEDVPLLEGKRWCLSPREGRLQGYARTAVQQNGTWAYVYMHQLIMGTPWVDHINGNGLDNRRCNLRHASPTQNNVNQGVSKANTSGIKGVSWSKRSKKWRVAIYANNRPVRVRYFASKDEAALYYRQEMTERHGDYARFA